MTVCPYCLASGDAIVCKGEPAPGDFGLCAECGSFFVYVEAGTRPLTDQEAEAVSKSEAAQKIKARFGPTRQ